MKTVLATLAAGLLVTAAVGEPPDLKAERARLQGTWQLVSETMDGQKQPPEYVRQIKLIFDAEGNWRVEKDGKLLFRGTSTIDPAKNPKELDSTHTEPEANKGSAVRAIYKVEGDTYTQCWAVGRPRPMAFKADATAGHNLSIFKRVESKDQSVPPITAP
jgi:uncharacterized protein (TIGR03067 family)